MRSMLDEIKDMLKHEAKGSGYTRKIRSENRPLWGVALDMFDAANCIIDNREYSNKQANL